MILKCNCRHPQQDALHGPQMRVHTPTTKSKAGSGTLREAATEKKA